MSAIGNKAGKHGIAREKKIGWLRKCAKNNYCCDSNPPTSEEGSVTCLVTSLQMGRSYKKESSKKLRDHMLNSGNY